MEDQLTAAAKKPPDDKGAGQQSPQRQKQRRRRKTGRQQQQQQQEKEGQPAETKTATNLDGLANTGIPKQKKGSHYKSKKKTAHNHSKKKGKDGQEQINEQSTDTGMEDVNADNKSKRKKREKKRRKKKPWWTKFIPPHTVDPITLEALRSLPYKPFALVATPPYDPVVDWPPKQEKVASTGDQKQHVNLLKNGDVEKADEEEDHRRRLEEQWGNKLAIDGVTKIDNSGGGNISSASENVDVCAGMKPAGTTDDDRMNNASSTAASGDKRHYHLYDGRALAYYVVSQGQYIDPLNRRDLTRDELINLDRYLVKHGFNDLKVVEAYDAKGVSISTAGTQAQTNEGRAEILQQTAQALLNSLFSARNPSSQNRQSAQAQHAATAVEVPQDSSGNFLRQQYAAHQQDTANTVPVQRNAEDTGIYGGDDGGLIIIDDDANPGLRGAGFQSAASATAADLSTTGQENVYSGAFWSASHIAERYNHEAAARSHNFPSLPQPSASVSAQATNNDQSTQPSLPSANYKSQPSKSLLKITKVVKKTDPAEIERQQKAREEAQRRAMLSNMSFVPDGDSQPSTHLSMEEQVAFLRGNLHHSSAGGGGDGPSDAKLERNKTLANALGVKPSTTRQDRGGWSRPTVAQIELDEFGNELNAARYPDSLILSAREKMDLLYKLERKWKKFLADDTSSSCPLRKMDKTTRALVHEYAAFWKLNTESFDPEPVRYIHCTKMRDTSIPHPLLSEAVINWRGPAKHPPLTSRPRSPIEQMQNLTLAPAPQQSSGQSTNSRERVPLKLLPRSEVYQGTMYDHIGSDAAVASLPSVVAAGFQMDAQHDATDRERPKLTLAPRSIPPELPPYKPRKEYTATFDEERERRQAEIAEKAKRQQSKEEQKKKLIEEAFQSDDEAESSEWEEESELYSGSDEEE